MKNNLQICEEFNDWFRMHRATLYVPAGKGVARLIFPDLIIETGFVMPTEYLLSQLTQPKRRTKKWLEIAMRIITKQWKSCNSDNNIKTID